MRPSKKQLLRTIRKETKPPKGFNQWVVILEAKKLSLELGLLRAEAYSDKRLEWSGSLSVSLPQPKNFAPDGRELPQTPDWDKLAVGQSSYTTLTTEMRGKTFFEGVKDFAKRSLGEGKAQDFLPLSKLVGLG